MKSKKELSIKEQDAFISIMSSLAFIDEKMDDHEKNYLMSVAKTWGISETEVKKVLNQPPNHKIDVPGSIDERYKQLAALIGMMLVDGKIYKEEFAFCELVAKKFGIDPATVNTIVTDIMSDIS